ncbi:MAG: hypothetical protein HY791_20940 [Deltaproteobacteria bacterium]|nr:hypothetical protein [Deltaproteobacteria bacterium]
MKTIMSNVAQPKPLLVSDLMEASVESFDEATTLDLLADLFRDLGSIGTTITDHGRVVGIVAPIDLPTERDSQRLLQASDVMEPVEEHVRKSWPVERADTLMEKSPLSVAVPVFADESEAVVGVLARASSRRSKPS